MHKRHTSQKPPKTAQPVFALTIKQTCAALGDISVPTCYKEINAGKLETFKIGNRRFSTPEACRKYVAARLKEAE